MRTEARHNTIECLMVAALLAAVATPTQAQSRLTRQRNRGGDYQRLTDFLADGGRIAPTVNTLITRYRNPQHFAARITQENRAPGQPLEWVEIISFHRSGLYEVRQAVNFGNGQADLLTDGVRDSGHYEPTALFDDADTVFFDLDTGETCKLEGIVATGVNSLRLTIAGQRYLPYEMGPQPPAQPSLESLTQLDPAHIRIRLRDRGLNTTGFVVWQSTGAVGVNPDDASYQVVADVAVGALASDSQDPSLLIVDAIEQAADTMVCYRLQARADDAVSTLTSPLCIVSRLRTPEDLEVREVDAGHLQLRWRDTSIGEAAFVVRINEPGEDWYTTWVQRQRRPTIAPIAPPVPQWDPIEVIYEDFDERPTADWPRDPQDRRYILTEPFVKPAADAVCFVVAALHPEAAEQQSAEVCVGLASVVPPPTDLTIDLVDATSVRVSWLDNSDETHFVVERGPSADPQGLAFLVEVPGTDAPRAAMIDDDLNPGTTYCYRVYGLQGERTPVRSAIACIDLPEMETPEDLGQPGGGDSEDSGEDDNGDDEPGDDTPEQEPVVETVPPAAPMDLQATALDADLVELDFEHDGTAPGLRFRFQRRAVGQLFQGIGTLDAADVHLGGWAYRAQDIDVNGAELQACTAYCYRVRAERDGLTSPWSADSCVKMPADAGVVLEAPAIDITDVAVSGIEVLIVDDNDCDVLVRVAHTSLTPYEASDPTFVAEWDTDYHVFTEGELAASANRAIDQGISAGLYHCYAVRAESPDAVTEPSPWSPATCVYYP